MELTTFTVNGSTFSVGDEYPPTATLLDYLRSEGVSTGTKSCCQEGGCGVCLVSVTKRDPVTKSLQTCSTLSCCLLLKSCDGLSVTTIEGLGSTKVGLHPIQERLATYDGAQCGYCSPAQVMNMYSLLNGKSQPNMKEVEEHFDTTLCRCTGYRSIMDAMKSFASDAQSSYKDGPIDIEEITKVCKTTGKVCTRQCSKQKSSYHQENRKYSSMWLKPKSLQELMALVDKDQKYRFVVGNTAFGVHKDLETSNFDMLIDTRLVPELFTIDLTHPDHIILGANLTLTNLKDLLEQLGNQNLLYAQTFAHHLKCVASTGIRNMASWAGNLMLKHTVRDFPSDIIVLFATVNARLFIDVMSTVTKSGEGQGYTMEEFLAKDMKGHVIVFVLLPKYKTGQYVIKTFRTAHRYQQCKAHISSGFRFEVDFNNDLLVLSKPAIVIQGISHDLIHAKKTEEYLHMKKLSNPLVIQESMNILVQELDLVTNGPLFAGKDYRKSLAVGHFYKFLLSVCDTLVAPRFKSGAIEVDRPVTSGKQDYGPVLTERSPANQPMMKVTAKHLTTGEIKFLDDQQGLPGLLYASVVLSGQGNSAIKAIDTANALAMDGVIKFLQASDIPGVNNWRPKSWYGGDTSELFSSGKVDYAGQPIGLIVADSPKTALRASKAVNVTYTNVKPVILDVIDAVEAKSFFPNVISIKKGDAESVMSQAPHRVKGSTRSGEQYHFHLENQTSLCSPSDTGGIHVQSTSQWIDFTQEVVSQILGLNASDVNVETQRLGGGFGGKIWYNGPVAGMCALAAHTLQRPVKLHMDLATNMQYQGCRMGYYYEYEVGFDDEGRIVSIITKAYCDAGSSFFSLDLDEHPINWLDNSYFIPNIQWTIQPCRTHKPVSTAMRAPGSATSIFAIESIIDHVASYLNIDHLQVRKINLLQQGQVTVSGMILEQCLIRDMMSQMEAEINYSKRKSAVEEFNKMNRWKKRGLHMMPSRYALVYTWLCFNTSVIIYHADGSVIIAHGAVDMGQGIDTKAIQTCAHKLGVPVDKIKVVKKSSTINANSHFTGGSVCSELICLAVLKSCETLLERLAPIRKKLVNPSWEELVSSAFLGGVNLTAQYWPCETDKIPPYNAYSVCCSEVELDVLTGEYNIIQVDYLYDCGTSLNPELDMGQLEGAFNMGCGLFLMESMKYDPITGKVLSDGTWNYKIPMSKDLPNVFNVKFLRNAPNPVGVLGSKAVGETPVAQGSCPLFALKRAVEAARSETGTNGWFPFYAPLSVEKLQQACLNDVTTYSLS